MILSYAFKNIFRNRRRSLITILSIFFAAMVVGFMQGWVSGLLNSFWDTFIQYQSGHVRVASKEFIKRERFLPVDEYISDSNNLKKQLLEIEHVKSVEERVRFSLLLSNADNTEPAVGVGLDLQKNSYNLKDKILKGEFSDSGVYIGRHLAERLKLSVGDTILIAAKTSEGGLNGIKADVKGVIAMGVAAYDKKYFFMSIETARTLLKLNGSCNEIIIFADNSENTDAINMKIKNIIKDDYISQTYIEQSGGVYDLFEKGKIFYFIIEGIIMFLASFVIINTLMMAILERVREIGTLKALGFSDNEVFRLFTFEGAIMGVIGGITGALFGFSIIYYLSINGINFENAISTIDMPFPYIMKPKVDVYQPIIAMIITITVPVISSMISARRIRRISPADALKK